MDTIIFLALLAVSIQYLVLHWIGYINIQKKKHDYVIALIRFFFSVGWFFIYCIIQHCLWVM